jgi:hypothetical protein
VLAWQGLCLQLPPEWNPIELTGTRKKGSIRVGNLHRTTLEVLWLASSRLDSKQGVWKRYLRRAGLPRRPIEGQAEDQPVLREALEKAGWRDPLAVVLRAGESRSLHALAQCPHSRRFVLVRMPIEAGDETAGPVELFNRFHEAEAGDFEWWNIYGFGFRVPADSRLVTSRLHSGSLSLSFLGRSVQITWQRTSFGTKAMGDRTLADWLAGHDMLGRRPKTWRPLPAPPRGGHALERTRCGLPRRTCHRVAAWYEQDNDTLVMLSMASGRRSMPKLYRALCRSWCLEERAGR